MMQTMTTSSKAAGVRERIERATVNMEEGGRGVLVAGGYVLIASHNLTWSHDERGDAVYAFESCHVETIHTADGDTVAVTVAFDDPVADIAALRCEDWLGPENAAAFESWIDSTTAVQLFRGAGPIAVEALNLDGSRVPGKASTRALESRIEIDLESDLQIGTSGGPIITRNGDLVAVVSQLAEVDVAGHKFYRGWQPRPSLALPAWLLSAIAEAESQRASDADEFAARGNQ